MTKIKEFKGSLNSIFNPFLEETIDTDLNIVNHDNKNNLLISHIRPRSDQPRKIFDESKLDELTQSIKSRGILQPIIVRAIKHDRYEIIAGERRWRAAQRAGLKEIPAIVKQYNDTDTMAVSLIENIQRENLNPLEEANAIHALLERCLMTHHQIAENIGKSRTTVSNILRLLNLEEETKQMMHAGLLQMGHARALLSLSGVQQIEIAKQVVEKDLSVREAEKLVNSIKNKISKKISTPDPRIDQKTREWQTQLTNQLLSKVDIHFKSDGKGKLIIYFESLEEADWFIKRVRVEDIE